MNSTDVDKFIDHLKRVRQTATLQQTNRSVRYFNVPFAFDIETSSFIRCGDKTAIMYLWSFACGDHVVTGRSWWEFMDLYNEIVQIFECSVKGFRVIIYIHNFQYEFQFMRKHFEWEKVFAVDNRKPVYQLSSDGVEFRCSYMLSGCNLDTVQKNLQRHDIKKLKGNLDFSKIRHCETELTQDELKYQENDVLILTAYIQEQMENCGNINKIPLTKTGFVRNFCRNYCLYGTETKPRKQNKTYFRFKKWINKMTLDTEEFKQLRRAFQGGFTHANSFYTNKVVDNVTSFDFTSSYPAVMVASDRFPIQPAVLIEEPDVETFKDAIDNYFQVFEIEFEGLESDIFYEHYLTSYKCEGLGIVVDNGRVVQAEILATTITSIDWLIICQCYRWKRVKIWDMRRYKCGYLPTNFVKQILTLYQQKTTLKGVQGKEVEYLLSKEMLNSCYGMTVCTKELTGESFDYGDDGHWTRNLEDLTKTLNKYNKKQSRFLFYTWGLVITAEQRLNLWSGILTMGEKGDYIYSDTDSVKITNPRKHKRYFDSYNQWITDRIKMALDFHGLPYEMANPVTKDGVCKPLGVWDFDGTYKRFKTLGAKRYMVETPDNDIKITVAGVSKSTAKYLVKTYGDRVFDEFKHGLYIPAGQTGKQTHTYIDCERKGTVIDYQGKEQRFHELSGIHLSDSDYLLSLSMDYLDFLSKEKIEIESYFEV